VDHAAHQSPQDRDRTDKRAELALGALSAGVLVLIGFMIVFVFTKAWPSFAHNGLAWFGPGGSIDGQLGAIFNSPADPSKYVYSMHAWPLLWGTVLVTGISLLLATVVTILAAMFIVEFAPGWLSGLMRPVVRLLAAVPSVIYGLIGALVLVPFIGNHIISQSQKESVQYVLTLDGSSLLAGVLVLTVMITPIMVAITVDALRSVPANWMEGAVALGVNRFRAVRTVGLRAVRPAIVAAAILAMARALGEAIMLSMVAGSKAFAPNLLDGPTFFVEPVKTLASEIVDGADGLSTKPFGQTMYAFAAILMISSFFFSFCGWYTRRAMRKYTLQAR
jgi:phosphate transport system permease protein